MVEGGSAPPPPRIPTTPPLHWRDNRNKQEMWQAGLLQGRPQAALPALLGVPMYGASKQNYTDKTFRDKTYGGQNIPGPQHNSVIINISEQNISATECFGYQTYRQQLFYTLGLPPLPPNKISDYATCFVKCKWFLLQCFVTRLGWANVAPSTNIVFELEDPLKAEKADLSLK